MTNVSPSAEPARARIVRVAQRVQGVQLRIAAIALVLMMAMTVADVFLRYAFNRPIAGSYDFVEAMLLIFVFNGIAGVFFGRANIVIDLIDNVIGERGATVLIRVSDVLSLATLLVFAWAMIGPAVQAYDYGDRKLELDLPIYILWIAALAGLAGTVFCTFGVLFGSARSDKIEQDAE